MIILDTPQGSTEWLTERMWRLTASNMKANITATGALSKSEAAIASIDKLIAGLQLVAIIKDNPKILDDKNDWEMQKFFSIYTGEKFAGNKYTERGKELEPDAVSSLAVKLGTEITDVGMCVIGDNANGVVSCSPDGLIYEAGQLVAGAEVKCPSLSTFYGYVADGELPDAYKMQVHASMAICDVNLWHFAAFFPGKPLFHVPVKRDKFTDTLETSLNDFRSLYAERFAKITDALQRISEEEGGL